MLVRFNGLSNLWISGKEKMKLNTLKLASAGAGLALAVGLGLMLRGDLVMGAIIFVIGMANFVRMVQLWREQ